MGDSYVNEDKGMTIYKDAKTGLWKWFGVVSNKFLDDDYPKKEIVSDSAHRKFVSALDTGEFKERTGLDMPEHWVFHVPVPIGVAEMVAYDERGFLIAGGHGFEGEFYDKVYEKLSQIPDMAMSHQMPGEFLAYNKEQDNIIDEYLSIEFTSLPLWAAANKRTISVHGKQKDGVKMPLQIEDGPKRDWFLENLGEDIVQDFDNRLSAMAEEAERNRVPSKEITMSEELKEQEVLDGASVEDTEVNAEVATETDEIAEVLSDDVDVEQKADQTSSDEEEDEEEDMEEGSKEAYVTRQELLEQVVPEIVKGVTVAIEDLRTQFNSELETLKSQMDTANAESAEQVKQTIDATPFASIAGMFARTVVGNQAAQVDYHKERQLHQDQPEEVSSEKSITGIPGLDKQIRGSRGNARVIPGPMFRNGQ